jgi:uncharacterized membrane protein
MAVAATARPVRTIGIFGHPIHDMLLPVAAVCFAAALVSDLVYANSSHFLMMWVNVSSWLILAGLLFGAAAALLLLVDLIRLRSWRSRGRAWLHWLLLVAALLVEAVNSLVHARDGFTAVVPLGLTLSIVATVLILVAAWLWRSLRLEAAR